jgi:hypothetical protein
MELLAFVLSMLGTVCICITPLLKGSNMKLILLLVFLTNALIAASYCLTGAYNGAASCCVGAVQSIINYFFERKNKPLPGWLIAIYAVSFVAVNLLVFAHATDMIALLATMAFIAAICQKSGRGYRLWTLVNAALWILYDLITASFGPLSTHAIEASTILLGMFMHDRKQKTA